MPISSSSVYQFTCSIDAFIILAIRSIDATDDEGKAAQKKLAVTRLDTIAQQFEMISNLIEMMAVQMKEKTDELVDMIEELVSKTSAINVVVKTSFKQFADQVLMPGTSFQISVNEIYTSTLKMLGKMLRTV